MNPRKWSLAKESGFKSWRYTLDTMWTDGQDDSFIPQNFVCELGVEILHVICMRDEIMYKQMNRRSDY